MSGARSRASTRAWMNPNGRKRRQPPSNRFQRKKRPRWNHPVNRRSHHPKMPPARQNRKRLHSRPPRKHQRRRPPQRPRSPRRRPPRNHSPTHRINNLRRIHPRPRRTHSPSLPPNQRQPIPSPFPQLHRRLHRRHHRPNSKLKVHQIRAYSGRPPDLREAPRRA